MKRIKLLSLLLAICILLPTLAACGKSIEEPQPETTKENEPADLITYELSVSNSVLHTDIQKKYLDGKYDNVLDEMDGSAERSYPKAVVLSWISHVPDVNQILSEFVVLSKDASFSDPVRIKSARNRVEIYNLEIFNTYYWYVEGHLGDQVSKSEVSSFTLSDPAPRNLRVSGVTNCRDLGGWSTVSGGRTVQGKVFRSGRLAGIDGAGRKTLLKDLGIKTEIDLRLESALQKNETKGKSMLGNDVNYVFLPMEWDVSNILTASANEESLLKVFEIFGDEANYPILFHCSIGTDRTGMIAFLISGLCGVSEEDLYRDYMFSGFGTINKTPNISKLTGYLNTVKKCSGKTLAEKIENYLLSRGVTAEQIATIRKQLT